jgi:hypothetical protein
VNHISTRNGKGKLAQKKTGKVVLKREKEAEVSRKKRGKGQTVEVKRKRWGS